MSVALILYIVDGSPTCIDAEARLRAAVGGRTAVELEVRNLSRVPAIDRTAADRAVAVVPLLELLRPRPEVLADVDPCTDDLDALLDRLGAGPRRRERSPTRW